MRTPNLGGIWKCFQPCFDVFLDEILGEFATESLFSSDRDDTRQNEKCTTFLSFDKGCAKFSTKAESGWMIHV